MLKASPSGSEHMPKKPTEQALNRACESCRLSKVRCFPNPVAGSTQCQRCAKAGKTCIFAPPAKRRQRKRTDVRVAELEREVRQMRSLLKSSRRASMDQVGEESGEEDGDDVEEKHESTSPTASRSFETPSPPPAKPDDSPWRQRIKKPWVDEYRPQNPPGPVENDIIERGLITMEMADELLQIYRIDLIPLFFGASGTMIPHEWSASDLRVMKPALFHAVMAAASPCKGEALSVQLHKEVVQLYAKDIFIEGERGLQWIQALLVSVSYYSPPEKPTHMQIYQFYNMAASMALELGLAYKPRTHEQLPKRAIRSLQKISSADELLENCRTILMLYVVTAGIATRLRRPNVLLFNSWMEECLSMLEKSPLVQDKRVVAWLKLQRIADEGMSAFGFDDASTSFSLSELRMQVIMKIFERRMHDWKKSIPPEVVTLPMLMEYEINTITLWEFGMDGARYDAPTFRNTHLTLPALDDDAEVQPESLLSRSALQINATIKCISAAQALLDYWVELPIQALQKTPNLMFVRPIYAIVVLLKVDYAVGVDAEGIGELLDSQSLKIDYYLDQIITRTSQAVGPQKCRIPSYWLFIIKEKIKAWHDEHQAWRRAGKHLKPKKPDDAHTSKDATDSPSTLAASDPASVPTQATEASYASNPTAPPSSSFGGVTCTSTIPNQFATWLPQTNNNSSTSLPTHFQTNSPNNPTSQQQQQQPQQQEFIQQAPPSQPGVMFGDIPEFSAAFQNGDLYFWNDVNDNFGGWMGPQGGSWFADGGFGGMGGM